MQDLYNKPFLTERNFQIFLLTYFLLAPLSYHLLPFVGLYGTDLGMQYYYNKCALLSPNAENLFRLTGEMCSDPSNGRYAYPVLIFRLFSFANFFKSFQSLYYFWTALISITIISAPYLWMKKRNKKFWFYLGIGIISLLQAPSFYALERGGTDITFLIPWIFATYFGLKEKWILAGVMMAIAALFKLYPVMALMPILLALFLDTSDKNKINFFKCGLAIGLTVLIIFLLDWHLWKTFVFEILPKETKYGIGTNAIGHSLIGPFPKFFVYLLMIVFWILYAKVFNLGHRSYKKLTFAGVLAMSTFYTSHSFDYNLITAFPFIYLCFELYFDSESPMKNNQQLMWSILLLSFTILGPGNYIFGAFHFIVRIKLLLELLAFLLVPLAILKKEAAVSSSKI